MTPPFVTPWDVTPSVVTPSDVLVSAVRPSEAEIEDSDTLAVVSPDTVGTTVEAAELSGKGEEEASVLVDPPTVVSSLSEVVMGRVVGVVTGPWLLLLVVVVVAAVTLRLQRFVSQQAMLPVQSCAQNNNSKIDAG